jgi:hypothetical protein
MLFVATGQWAQAQTTMDANTILTANMSQFQQVPAYKMNCSATCDLIAEDGKTIRSQHGKTVVFRDGEKFEFRLNRYENAEENGLKIRDISNGQQLLIQQGQGAAVLFSYSDDPNYITSHNQTAWAGDFLDRYSLGDGVHVASYLLSCPQKELLPTMESIEGHPCYVIHAASERGLIKIWIDPANGYQYRKLIIEKKHGNLEGDHKLPFKPIPQSDIELDQIKVEVDVQTIQKFDNVYFTLAGSIKVVQNFSDGSVKKFEY